MPEDQEKNNNQENQSMTDKDQGSDFRGVTPESKKRFEEVLEEVRRGMESHVNEENADVLNSNSLLFTVGENAARKVAGIAAEKYQKKIDFERTNLGFQRPQNSPRVYDTTAESQEDRMETIKTAKQAEIIKTAQEEAKKNLDAEQQGIAVRIAEGRAMSILQKVAEEMADIAEGGGFMGEVIILFTFVLAIAKDLTDALLVALAAATLPIPILDIALPASLKLVSWIIGFATSTILIFFWMTVSGSWKGGLATNWILKVVLRFILGGVMEAAVSILPVYTILNAWCYYDYRKEQNNANEKLEGIQEEAEQVRNKVNSDLRNISTAS